MQVSQKNCILQKPVLEDTCSRNATQNGIKRSPWSSGHIDQKKDTKKLLQIRQVKDSNKKSKCTHSKTSGGIFLPVGYLNFHPILPVAVENTLHGIAVCRCPAVRSGRLQELFSCVWDTLRYIVDACRCKDVKTTFYMSNLRWESYNRWIPLIRWGPCHWSGDSSMQWIFDEKVWLNWKIWCGFWTMRHGPDFWSWQIASRFAWTPSKTVNKSRQKLYCNPRKRWIIK